MKAFPRDIDVRNMTERHIGVESELRVGRNGCDIPDGLERALKKRGLFQDVGYDGGGREFRTNPISIKSLKQVRGSKYLREYYTLLQPHTRIIPSGGTHIHISILDSDRPEMEAHATALGVAFYEQFQKVAGRKTGWASKFNCNSVEDIRGYLDDRCESGRTYGCKGSMLNPTYHKTLEFRGPKGSNDPEEILAWTEFLENVVKRANRKSIKGVKFADLIKGERIEAYISNLKGWRKLTKSDLNKSVNVNALA